MGEKTRFERYYYCIHYVIISLQKAHDALFVMYSHRTPPPPGSAPEGPRGGRGAGGVPGTALGGTGPVSPIFVKNTFWTDRDSF